MSTFDQGFTIPAEHANAWWVAKASVRWSTETTSTVRYIQFNGIGSVNGVGLHRLQQVNGANEPFSQMMSSSPFMLAAGDTLGVQVQHGHGSTVQLEDFFGSIWISIERIAVSGTG